MFVQSRQEGGCTQQLTGLLLFCGLLLKTCEYDAGPVFQRLLEAFRADLSVDNSLFAVSPGGPNRRETLFVLFSAVISSCRTLFSFLLWSQDFVPASVVTRGHDVRLRSPPRDILFWYCDDNQDDSKELYAASYTFSVSLQVD